MLLHPYSTINYVLFHKCWKQNPYIIIIGAVKQNRNATIRLWKWFFALFFSTDRTNAYTESILRRRRVKLCPESKHTLGFRSIFNFSKTGKFAPLLESCPVSFVNYCQSKSGLDEQKISSARTKVTVKPQIEPHPFIRKTSGGPR
jgi:hypothetical protein